MVDDMSLRYSDEYHVYKIIKGFGTGNVPGQHSRVEKDDSYDSTQLLLKMAMDKHGISQQDLRDINIVKSKIRDSKIGEILD
jgi:hypothetical protein